jgi:quercetin dioxygenase-like cupin family protein
LSPPPLLQAERRVAVRDEKECVRLYAQAWKVIVPPEHGEPERRTHEGYEWLYVLSGRMRLIVADHDITLEAGEVAEFDTRLPHWFGAAGDETVELLSLLGKHGERMHVRTGPASTVNDA